MGILFATIGVFKYIISRTLQGNPLSTSSYSFLNADVILIDLGAGTSSLILDLFLSKMRGIVICNPEPQSRVSAYGLLKNIIFRHISNQCGDIDALQTALTNFLLGPARKNGRILDLLDSIMKIDSDICDNIIKDVEKFDFCLILNRFRKRADIHDFERFNRLILNYLSKKVFEESSIAVAHGV